FALHIIYKSPDLQTLRPSVRQMADQTLNSLLSTSSILRRPSSSMFDPLGRHSPFSNSFSDVPLTKAGHPAKTGCRCIGFQRGRDSIFAPSKARRSFSRSVPATAGSITMQVSQKFEWKSVDGSDWNVTPGTSLSSSRYHWLNS